MKAYAIVQETITDPAMFDEYRKDVPASLQRFGGEFVIRGGEVNVLEGALAHPRLVVIAFPSRQAALDWYNSPEYQKIIPLRLKSSHGIFAVVDGVA